MILELLTLFFMRLKNGVLLQRTRSDNEVAPGVDCGVDYRNMMIKNEGGYEDAV